MTMGTERPGPARPLRADAARNHRRIVAAAAEAFEEQGPEVSLEEIAHRAGLGVATLYRRFRTREQLIRAVAHDVFITKIEPAAAADTGDAWADLTGSLTRTFETIAGHKVLITAARETSTLDTDMLQRVARVFERLLERARADGVVRPELTVRDLGAVLLMWMATIRADPQHGDDRYRYLALLIDGLRPSPTPLPPSADACPGGVSAPPGPPSARPGH